MKVRLEVSHNRANVRHVTLRKDTVIGRSAECSLRIASRGVSRRHCMIILAPEGVYVRDLGSSNGTQVDGIEIDPETDVAVGPGTQLTVGGVRFVVHFESPVLDTAELPVDKPGSTVDFPPEQAHRPSRPPSEKTRTANSTSTIAALRTGEPAAGEAGRTPGEPPLIPATRTARRVKPPADDGLGFVLDGGSDDSLDLSLDNVPDFGFLSEADDDLPEGFPLIADDSSAEFDMLDTESIDPADVAAAAPRLGGPAVNPSPGATGGKSADTVRNNPEDTVQHDEADDGASHGAVWPANSNGPRADLRPTDA